MVHNFEMETGEYTPLCYNGVGCLIQEIVESQYPADCCDC